MDNERLTRVALTIGDTNGIGIEVLTKVLATPDILELFTPIVYGSSKVMNYHRKAMDLPSLQLNNISSALEAKDGVVNIVECCDDEVKVDLGTPDKVAGRAARMALTRATLEVRDGFADVLVTSPICKDTIQSDDFHFMGHTDYLEATVGGERDRALMMMTAGNLRVALATVHMQLRDVPELLSVKLVRERIVTLDNALRRDYAIERPRIAVLALNPHAGENGLLGLEERDVIAPAINAAYDEDRVMCFGPYAADGFFGARQWEHFDAVLAMYHDQGLIPFKAIAMQEGVNHTAGLPIVRTSPDHGTGFDIAGKGIAAEQPLRSAIYAAIDIHRNRLRYDEAAANPLQRQLHDRKADK